jgi:hypothetical protein
MGHFPIESFIFAPSLFIVYIHESSTLTKTFGDKSVMLLKTHWKLYENSLGTRWECIENRKKQKKSPSQKPKRK